MSTEDSAADAQLDARLEAMARPEPPRDHVARVLARIAEDVGTGGKDASLTGPPERSREWRHPSLSPRWALLVAATLIVALTATWHRVRAPAIWPELSQTDASTIAEVDASRVAEVDASRVAEVDASARRPYQREAWGTPDEIVQPVLPPQAYWGMDAFEEWRTLGRQPATGKGQPEDGNRQAPGAGHGGVVAPFGYAVGADAAAPAATPHSRGADDEFVWAPVPSGLPEIALSSIVPPPLEVVPLDEPLPITLQDITLEPIELAPYDQQEKP